MDGKAQVKAGGQRKATTTPVGGGANTKIRLKQILKKQELNKRVKPNRNMRTNENQRKTRRKSI